MNVTGIHGGKVHAGQVSKWLGHVVIACTGRTMMGTPTSEPVSCKACAR